VRVRIRAAFGNTAPLNVDLRVSGQRITAEMDGDELVFEVQRVLDHELVVIDWEQVSHVGKVCVLTAHGRLTKLHVLAKKMKPRHISSSIFDRPRQGAG